MAYISVVGFCFLCRRLFSFNPIRVPSIRVDGERQPICLSCIEQANRERQTRGLEPFRIDPDAYNAEPDSNVWDDD